MDSKAPKRLLSVFTALYLCVNVFSAAVYAKESKTAKSNTVTPTSKAELLFPDSEFYFLDDAKNVNKYLKEAEKRKKAIIGSKTEIIKSDKYVRGKTYTGTAYYVAADGKAENDGLSPETPWNIEQASMAHFMKKLKAGDAVFFKRGDVFRLKSNLVVHSDVTYSAYGKGAKPVFTIAQENSAREECWKLYSTGKNGEKIWKYCKTMNQTGGIVFDDETYAEKVWEWPTKKGWQELEFTFRDFFNEKADKSEWFEYVEVRGTGKYLSVKKALKKDLTFLCRADIKNIEYPYIPRDYDDYSKNSEWQLYLRCDKGNPGKIYKDIEVIAPPSGKEGVFNLIWVDWNPEKPSNGVVIDNISLKGFVDNAIGADTGVNKNIIVQNCTVEWGGNRLFKINSEKPDIAFMCIGDSVYGVGNDSTVRNNYFRHCGNSPTFEGGDPKVKGSLGTYTCTGNISEYCAQGMRGSLYEHAGYKDMWFDKVVIKDNYYLNTGYYFNNACMETPAAIDLCNDGAINRFAKKFIVSDNVIIGSEALLIRMPDSRLKLKPKNNVFIQKRGGALAYITPHNNKIEVIPFSKQG